MLYCIAIRNNETDKFELKTTNNVTKVYSDPSEAIDECVTQIKLKGEANVRLLQEVILDVTFEVKKSSGLNG